MKKKIKIVGTVLLAVLAMGSILSLWFFDHNMFNTGLEFFVYMIGYGDASANVVVRLFLAIAGILIVAVFSSYITVVFIEQKSKLTIDNKLYFNFDGTPSANFKIKTKQWDLYDLEIKLLFPFNGNIYRSCDYGKFAYLPKDSNREVVMNIQRGEPLFWYLQTLWEQGSVDELIVKIDFVNGKNNQSYSAIQKYELHKNIFADGKIWNFNKADLQKICGVHFDLHNITPVNAQYIDFEKVIPPLPLATDFNNGICAHVDLTKANNWDFGMLFFKKPFNGCWDYFKNEGYSLVFSCFSTTNLFLKIEIKTSHSLLYGLELKTDEGLKKIKIPLSAFDDEDMKDIKELCFAVFRTDNNACEGDLYLFDCRMEKSDEKKF